MIDIGVNLASTRFDNARESILENAYNSGVKSIILTGSCFKSNDFCSNYCRDYTGNLNLYFTAGLHPHYASAYDAECDRQIKKLSGDKNLVAIGEMGLDYQRMLSTKQQQKIAFIKQLQLATEFNKPVFLHQRDAHSDFLAIISEYANSLPNLIVHCFTDTVEALRQYLDLGCYIGITGWISDKNRGESLRAAVKYIPSNRLLIETDAPYLLPHNIADRKKYKYNQPQFLKYVLQAIATERDESFAELAQIISQNSADVFKIKN